VELGERQPLRCRLCQFERVADAAHREGHPAHPALPRRQARRGRQLANQRASPLARAAADEGDALGAPGAIGHRRQEQLEGFGLKFPGVDSSRDLARGRGVHAGCASRIVFEPGNYQEVGVNLGEGAADAHDRRRRVG